MLTAQAPVLSAPPACAGRHQELALAARLAPGELMGMEGATRGSERRDRGQSINPHAPLSVRAPWPQGCGDFRRDGLPIKFRFINQKHKLRVAMRNVSCNLSSLPQYVSRSTAKFSLTAHF